MPNDALMTSTEAGLVLGVSNSTVRRMAEPGANGEAAELPYAQKLPGPNGNYLFDPAEVWALAAKREQAKAATG